MKSEMPKPNQERACGRCMWWLPLNSVAGYCKRMPPYRTEDGEGLWPMTGRGDWCGEYIPMPKEGE